MCMYYSMEYLIIFKSLGTFSPVQDRHSAKIQSMNIFALILSIVLFIFSYTSSVYVFHFAITEIDGRSSENTPLSCISGG